MCLLILQTLFLLSSSSVVSMLFPDWGSMYRVSVLLFFQLLTMYHSSSVTVLGTNIVVSTLFPDTEELVCHCSRLLPSLQFSFSFNYCIMYIFTEYKRAQQQQKQQPLYIHTSAYNQQAKWIYDREAKWGHAVIGTWERQLRGKWQVQWASGGNATQTLYVCCFSFFTSLTWFLHNKEGQATTRGAPAKVEHPWQLAGDAGLCWGDPEHWWWQDQLHQETEARDCHWQGGAPTMTRDH